MTEEKKGEGGGWLKGLGRGALGAIGIELTDEAPAAPVNVPAENVSAQAPAAPVGTASTQALRFATATTPIRTSVAGADPVRVAEFVKAFKGVASQASGPFSQFQAAMDGVKDFIKISDDVYRAGIEVLKRQNIGVDKVKTSLTSCLNAIEEARKAQVDSVEQKKTELIGASEKKHEAITANIAALELQIAQLRKEQLELAVTITTEKTKSEQRILDLNAAAQQASAEFEEANSTINRIFPS